ncbi:glycosyltransferase family 2 protein [Leptolyngbya sp. KIOST-1]|uniref:glycosyltransferase family 2 protein n=1 Tax=Leptolyngbya sp. KIOST-1 TaxID=1229172 RepID=UPI0018CF14A3|nr:glycosyltransferase [Leptolyngbya sp. KIOST-1]
MAELEDGRRSSPLGIAQLPLPQTRVSVIVPVRNEAEILLKSLLALVDQTDFENTPLVSGCYEVIVLANNCTDASAAIARRVARQHPQVPIHVVERSLPQADACIGRVRQLLMDEAYWRLQRLSCSRGIIASTDGDSQVDRRWVAAILQEIEQGADAVGGRTVIHQAERSALDKATRASYLRFVGYRYLIKRLEDYLDPDPFDRSPRHYQFFGANFAVTQQMYAQAGGLPPVQTGEDVAFYQSLIAAGARVRHSYLMRVTTSARPQGRAALGLADRLSQFQALGQRRQAFFVASAAEIEAQLLARRQLRRYWRQTVESPSSPGFLAPSRLVRLASQWAVPLGDLCQAVKESATVGELLLRVEQRQQAAGLWQQRWAQVPIEVAIADLRLCLHQWQQRRGLRSLVEV